MVASSKVPSSGIEASFGFNVYSNNALDFRNQFGKWLAEAFAKVPDVGTELLKPGVSGK